MRKDVTFHDPDQTEETDSADCPSRRPGGDCRRGDLLLLLGREEEYKPFDVRRDQNTNAITYCAVKGEMELNFQTVSSIQLPCYSFLPTQGVTMTQDGMSNSSVAANPGIPWYSDLYENEAGEEMGFYQMPAAADLLTDLTRTAM